MKRVSKRWAGVPNAMSRRGFFAQTGAAIGACSLGGMLWAPSATAQVLAAPPQSAGGILPAAHFPARAKRVVFIQMCGGVSQVDTFDYKPTLERLHGQDLPPSVRGTQRLSTMVQGQTAFPIVKPIRPFRQYGESGAWVSDLLPYTAKIVDELAFIKTMTTPHVNHQPASKFLHSGFQLAGRPSMGSWIRYGLGADNANLPAFITLVSRGTGSGQSVDAAVWGAGFLPSHYEGVRFRSGVDPVLYIRNPEGFDVAARREELDVIRELSEVQFELNGDPEVLSRIAQYEMAFRMQESVPDVADISDEPDHVLDLYGPEVRTPGTFARNCLLARRLIERDVKVVNLCQTGWDSHVAIHRLHPADCAAVDQPSAALVSDLKQRGLLEDTLVVWSTEFGRTCFAQGALDDMVGRDHNGGAFTIWLAGAGVKRGATYGETDEFSYSSVRDPVSIHDLHATILYLLGVDHERLTFKHLGRDYRLTDVEGRVVHGVLDA